MVHLLPFLLAASQCLGLAASASLKAPPSGPKGQSQSFFIKKGPGLGEDAFQEYDASDYSAWEPDPSIYDGVPMVVKKTVVDGKNLTYQDFDVEKLSLDQFKKHLMGADVFYDEHKRFLFNDADAEAYR
ncbi:hypothetical protein UVI_02050700 [Ustilaginoidea virens]|nr:hypothetical protein UVI_02050700 [Ustilaginoidea virens]